ncbi:zinc finger protein DPF3-like isoform X2 [Acanthaster planci]|uniref:Zinc finger protein DPF3-like isoform X2 n=1 Tax=Acanthaster planci TaxID=133434 RepID=A0A8B7YCG9_ACAPL|nr:zinc finger protein DPF3-like isoform X2 [Acanthaster planci]
MSVLFRKNSDYEQFYREATENAASFNTRLVAERKMRLPFLDSQTGVAQNNCFLWMQKRHRFPGRTAGQLYSYPSRRWRKKRKPHQVPLADSSNLYVHIQPGVTDGIEVPETVHGTFSETDQHAETSNMSLADREQEELFREMEAVDDIPDAGEIERNHSDESDEDFEVSSRKKRGRKGRGGGRKKANPVDIDMPTLQAEDKEKPFGCKAKKKMIKGIAEPNNYCDFCLGDTFRNKEGTQEELVSCADCGRSGHPSCLQFTENITAKVKSYRWQCIECKSCGLCGTSDNDDQLLFCDDCDRGYHMYCLKPPMSSPPEGSWICDLCMAVPSSQPSQSEPSQASNPQTSVVD